MNWKECADSRRQMVSGGTVAYTVAGSYMYFVNTIEADIGDEQRFTSRK